MILRRTIVLVFNLLAMACANHVEAQTGCDCPAFEIDSHKTVVVVTNTDDLQEALLSCLRDSGNYHIVLAPGEYLLERNLLFISQEMNHLSIVGQTGFAEDVKIFGDGMEGKVTHIFNVAADHFLAADMTIGKVANHAVQIHGNFDADSCLIQNVIFTDVNEQMLKVSSDGSERFSDGGIVRCCHFSFSDGIARQYYTGGVDAHQASGWQIVNNYFEDIKSPEQSLSEHAIHFWSDSKNTLVENNLIVDCDRGIGLGLGDRGHGAAIIRNNVVHTSRDVGIGLENAEGVEVYYNTVVTDNYPNSIEYRFDGTKATTIHSNLTTARIFERNGGQAELMNNLELSDRTVFVDPDLHDYHLSAAHPNIVDRGYPLNDLNDIDCDNQSVRDDIGADEFDGATTLTTDRSLSSMLVYPNPSEGLINIQGPIGEYFISDILGRRVLVINKKEATMNLSLMLKNGVYLIENENGAVCKVTVR